MKHTASILLIVLGATTVACGSSKNEPESPPQGYYQSPPPAQPAPMQPAPMQPAPAPAPAPTPAPAPAATTPPASTAPAAGSATPTAIPGVMKNADGTCSITPPGGQPLTGPCPPGI